MWGVAADEDGWLAGDGVAFVDAVEVDPLSPEGAEEEAQHLDALGRVEQNDGEGAGYESHTARPAGSQGEKGDEDGQQKEGGHLDRLHELDDKQPREVGGVAAEAGVAVEVIELVMKPAHDEDDGGEASDLGEDALQQDAAA